MIELRRALNRPAWWQWRRRRRYDEYARLYRSMRAHPGTRFWNEIERLS